MKLLNNIIDPSHWRKHHFKSGAENPPYTWQCIKCKVENQLTFDELAKLYWSESLIFEKSEYENVKSFYGIGLVEKSHEGGWPFYKIIKCTECFKQYLIYVGIQEPANSLLMITVQAITEISDS